MKKIVILYSGGLDSMIMAKWAEVNHPDAEVIKVYYDIGHDYSYKEKAVLPPDVIIHDMSWFNAKGVGKEGNATGSCFIPGRNMVFSVLAASQYLPDEIWLGALKGEIHAKATDKNELFSRELSLTMTYVLSPFIEKVKLVYPLADADMGKLDATRWALQHGLKDAVLKSSSCMEGEAGNCGRCATCCRRWGIFTQLGLTEKYNRNPVYAVENRSMLIEMLETEMRIDAGENFSPHYDEYRRAELVPALVKHFGTSDLSKIKSTLLSLAE